jgi:phosphate transport system substrate-binding protein
VTEFTSEKAIGEFGYLADRGLIPAPMAEREKVRAEAASLTPLELASGH